MKASGCEPEPESRVERNTGLLRFSPYGMGAWQEPEMVMKENCIYSQERSDAKK